MSSHPKFFEKKFVGCSGKITNQEVKDLIRTAIPPGTNQVKLELLRAIGLFIDQSTEEGETIAFMVKYMAILNYIHLCMRCSTVTDLRKFLLFCTGCQEVSCNRLTVQFTNDDLAPAVSANTCSRALTLSLRITPPQRLVEALQAVIQGTCVDFTMV